MTTPTPFPEPRAVSVGEHAGGHSATSANSALLSSMSDGLAQAKTPLVSTIEKLRVQSLADDGSAVRAGGNAVERTTERTTRRTNVAGAVPVPQTFRPLKTQTDVTPARTTDIPTILPGDAARDGTSPGSSRAVASSERMQALDRVLYRVLYTMTAEFIERAFNGYHGEERDEPDAYHREVDTL